MLEEIQEIKRDVRELVKQGAFNTATLQEHMKRTELNETRIEKLEYWILGLLGSALVAFGAAVLKLVI